ncbi:MAG: chromosome segregation protein SMC [Myxococcota bacterium]|jgi:chromosome segregation protein|nr:chromosome segregation protein SMC [Myxococcota bacterium]
MRIKRVDISGFKSFCDPVRVVFDHAVTAVVGPNGCGKSNILDAVRWALGEQSSKNLRGLKMEDVIFNGSDRRGPQSMAEVTITFDNTDGRSHTAYVDYPEVAVTRRLHRDGTSEYLINKTSCRLMDITDLFLGTGGGARAYSIIEQGRIGLIVSARTEDRRAMIEEAAGITKYKKARASAERRMDQTRQNLLRVSDIVNELERNLANLDRAAKKAARYKRYREEQTDLELYLASHRYLELCAQSRAVSAMRLGLEERKVSTHDVHAACETKLDALRIEEQHTRSLLDRKVNAGYELDNEVRIIEKEIEHLQLTMRRLRSDEAGAAEQKTSALRQQTDLAEEAALLDQGIERTQKTLKSSDERLSELTERVEASRDRLAELGAAHDARRDRVSRSKARLAASDNAISNLELRIAEAEQRVAHAQEQRLELETSAKDHEERIAMLAGQLEIVEKRLSTAHAGEQRAKEQAARLGAEVESMDGEQRCLQAELQDRRSRKASLEEVMRALSSHDSSVRDAVALLRSSRPELLEGLLVDCLECDERYEIALAAALGEQLQALLVDSRADALAVLTTLKDKDAARVSVVAKQARKACLPVPRLEDGAVLCRLMDVLRVAPGAQAAVASLLSNVFVTSSLQEAERLWNGAEGRASFVTLDGQVLLQGGVVRGGKKGAAGANLLRQKRQIRELEGEVDTLATRLADLEERYAALKEEVAAHTMAAERARLDAKDQQIVLAELRKDRTRAIEDLAALSRRRASLDAEVKHQEERLCQARLDHDRTVLEVKVARAEISELEQTLAELSAQIDVVRMEVDRLNTAASDVRVQRATLEQQERGAVARLEQIARQREELATRLVLSERSSGDRTTELGRTAGRIFSQKESLALRLLLVRSVKTEIDAQRREVDSAAEARTAVEDEIKLQRVELDRIASELSSLTLAERESYLAVDHLIDSVADRHDVNLKRVVSDYHMREIPGQDIKVRVEEIKGVCERMLPINLGAIEEFEQQNLRYEELSGQKRDLEQAMEDLERAIARMDKESRQKFKATFDDVNARFKVLFPKLFNGGSAELRLTDPADMLRTGVDILAHPPGKKPGNIELLSGGEKALTAVGLLFAIFQHRPSPFCVLDEVDAPLDEANISRFIDMVNTMTDRSQFIIITHSKLTMERSDALYGVTMEEPGVSKLVSVRLSQASQQAGLSAASA